MKGLMSSLFGRTRATIIVSCAVMLGLVSQLHAKWEDHTYYPQEAWLATYLSEMPWQHYKSYKVVVRGKDCWFWVDQAKDCVKDTVKSGTVWEQYIIDTLARYIKPGDRVIDLGAHIGTISLAMSHMVGDKGTVYSFEGERQFFRELVHNSFSNGRKNIIPHLCWVSDREEDVLVTDYYGFDTYGSPVHANTDLPWIRHVRALDSFGFQNISVIKCDVECTEDEVIQGAIKLISESRPIFVIEIMGGFGHSKEPEVLARISAYDQNATRPEL